MMPQAWQQLDFSESAALLREQPDSSPRSWRVITNVAFAEALPKVHVLSYLIRPDSNASVANQDAILNGQTANLDGLNKLPVAEEHAPRHIIFLKTQPRQSTFTSLQKWEGVVLEVLDTSFVARLVDLTQTGPDEEAEFPLDEISAEDRPLVCPGAIFYWNIGYHTSYSGQRMRTSIMRFRRLPAWTRAEIEAAKREAERIGKAIGWE